MPTIKDSYQRKASHLYSPRIPDELIRLLYRQGRREQRPMTHLVRDAVTDYLAKHGTAGERNAAQG